MSRDQHDRYHDLILALRPDLPMFERARGLPIRYEVRSSESRRGRLYIYVSRHKLYSSAIKSAWSHIAQGYDVELIDLETMLPIEIPYSEPEPEEDSESEP